MLRTTTVLLIFIAIHSTAFQAPAQVVGDEGIEVVAPPLTPPPPILDVAADEAPVESDLEIRLKEELAGMDELPATSAATAEMEDLPDLPNLSLKPDRSTIHVLPLKYASGQWACSSLQDVFEEEVAAGECRLTSADNIVIVRTRDAELFEKIADLLKVLDAPADNPVRVPDPTNSNIVPADIRNSFSNVVLGRFGQGQLNDSHTRVLVERWHAAPADEREAIAKSLIQHVESQFENRQQRQRQQIDQLRERLQRLESTINRRTENRNDIIRQTTEKLLSGSSENEGAIAKQAEPLNSGFADNPLPLLQNQANGVPISLSKEEIELLRLQAKTAKVKYDTGTLPHLELLRAQAAYQSAIRVMRQRAAYLETQIQLRTLDLKEAESNYAAKRDAADQARRLKARDLVSMQSVAKATAQIQIAKIDVERAKVQFDAVKTQLEACKSVQDSLDSPDEIDGGDAANDSTDGR